MNEIQFAYECDPARAEFGVEHRYMVAKQRVHDYSTSLEKGVATFFSDKQALLTSIDQEVTLFDQDNELDFTKARAVLQTNHSYRPKHLSPTPDITPVDDTYRPKHLAKIEKASRTIRLQRWVGKIASRFTFSSARHPKHLAATQNTAPLDSDRSELYIPERRVPEWATRRVAAVVALGAGALLAAYSVERAQNEQHEILTQTVLQETDDQQNIRVQKASEVALPVTVHVPVTEAAVAETTETSILATTTTPTTVAPATTATTVATTVTEAPTTTHSQSLDEWLYTLRMCESTDNYHANTGNGYYGAYQFLDSTWDSLQASEGYAYAHQALPHIQDAAVIENTLRSSDGLASQHPGCFKKHNLSAFPPGY